MRTGIVTVTLDELSPKTKGAFIRLLWKEYPTKHNLVRDIDTGEYHYACIHGSKHKIKSLLHQAMCEERGEKGYLIKVRKTSTATVFVREKNRKKAYETAISMAKNGQLQFTDSLEMACKEPLNDCILDFPDDHGYIPAALTDLIENY